MHTKGKWLCRSAIFAALTLALTAPFVAFADAYTRNNIYAGDGGGKSQHQDADSNWITSGRAFAGYRFNNIFSLETGYAALGKHDSSANTVRERGPFIQALVHFDASESFSHFLKGGMHRLEVTTHISTADSKESNTDPAWSAGLDFNFGKHMGLQFEWERFKIKNHDTDLVSENIVHHFREQAAVQYLDVPPSFGRSSSVRKMERSEKIPDGIFSATS